MNRLATRRKLASAALLLSLAGLTYGFPAWGDPVNHPWTTTGVSTLASNLEGGLTRTNLILA